MALEESLKGVIQSCSFFKGLSFGGGVPLVALVGRFCSTAGTDEWQEAEVCVPAGDC